MHFIALVKTTSKTIVAEKRQNLRENVKSKVSKARIWQRMKLKIKNKNYSSCIVWINLCSNPGTKYYIGSGQKIGVYKQYSESVVLYTQYRIQRLNSLISSVDTED